MSSTRTRPIEKFAKATSKCSVEVYLHPISMPRYKLTVSQAAAYGKCVVADYTAVQKDMCAKEFMKLKNCFLVRHKVDFNGLVSNLTLLIGGIKEGLKGGQKARYDIDLRCMY
jgi:hypothetical protein